MREPGYLKSQWCWEVSFAGDRGFEGGTSRWTCTCLKMKKSDGHEMAHILSSFVGKRPVPEVTNRWVGKRGVCTG